MKPVKTICFTVWSCVRPTPNLTESRRPSVGVFMYLWSLNTSVLSTHRAIWCLWCGDSTWCYSSDDMRYSPIYRANDYPNPAAGSNYRTFFSAASTYGGFPDAGVNVLKFGCQDKSIQRGRTQCHAQFGGSNINEHSFEISILCNVRTLRVLWRRLLLVVYKPKSILQYSIVKTVS